MQVLAAHCVEAEFRHRGQPGHHARTCLLHRQGTAAAAHTYACFSKGYSGTASRAPLQRLWGSKAHTYGLACIYAHTHTHMHAHTYTHTDTNARDYSQACTRTYTCTRTNTQTHARAHIQTPKHTGIHTRTHAYAYACTRCARDGLRQFFCQLGSKFRQVAGTETNTQEGKKF